MPAVPRAPRLVVLTRLASDQERSSEFAAALRLAPSSQVGRVPHGRRDRRRDAEPFPVTVGPLPETPDSPRSAGLWSRCDGSGRSGA
jgi:hypothetical protein